jgi:hypothetical protein
MTHSRIICSRLDQETNHRIARALGSRYLTRSRFIRTAIERLLLQEEGHMRLRAAEMTIEWG